MPARDSTSPSDSPTSSGDPERAACMSETASTDRPDLGPNEGMVDEMFRLFQDDPQAVSESWREFFADYKLGGTAAALAPVATEVEQQTPVPKASVREAGIPPRSEPGPERPGAERQARESGKAPVVLPGESPETLRGAAARVVKNMEASLEVPTATSVRAVPAKLLEVNRQILNNHLARARAGKVSFTHLIGYAVVRALQKVPVMNSSFGFVDGKPTVVHHAHVNLGLAIDLEKPDGSRTLIVPNVKQADTLDFASFHAAYEDLVRRARSNQLTPDDLGGTTVSI